MAATWHWYGNALLSIAKADIDFDTATFKVMLAQVGYTPDPDHQFRSSVTNEPSPSGTYVAGGTALDGLSVAYDSANNRATVTWSDEAWTGATLTARHAIIYKDTGNVNTDNLIAYASESADVSSTNGTFTVDMPTPVLTITAT